MQPSALGPIIAVMLLAATPARSATPIAEQLLRLADSDLRVARVASQLLYANAGHCTRKMPGTGLVLHSSAQYSAAARPEALALWSFPSAVSIEAVVPQSPADRAGLRPGDGITAIAGQILPGNAPPSSGSTYLRDAAERLIQSLPAESALQLRIMRGGREFEILLAPAPSCRARIEVVAGSSVKARSDGDTIQLGQEFVDQIDDAGLAVALAHELAHTILDHRAKLSRLESVDQPIARREHAKLARQFEDEADLLSLNLLASAGWDPAIAPHFMRKSGKHFEPLIPRSRAHRSTKDRARRMELAISATGLVDSQ